MSINKINELEKKGNIMFKTYEILGLTIEYWVGWVIYIIALIFGGILSVHQEHEIDKEIKYLKFKPLYSMLFGFFVTTFGIPQFFKDITVWELIIPAIVISAIASNIIYIMLKYATLIIEYIVKKYLNINIKFKEVDINNDVEQDKDKKSDDKE